MPVPSLHFWHWNRPILAHAVQELTRGWKSGPLDLSDTIILCPTAEAVRRLRQALAEAASSRDSAVMAPHVWHPSTALAPTQAHPPIAPLLQERMAWTHVLLHAELAGLSALFPTPPEQQDHAWASAVAETLRSVRHDLGAAGLSIEDAVPIMEELEPGGRWPQLAALERQYLLCLEDWGLRDSQASKRLAAHSPLLPDGVSRVLVCAVPDAPLLLLQWLAHLPATVETIIFVHAPESERARFSTLGVPLPSAWGDDAGVECPLVHAEMHRVAAAEEQARQAVRLLESFASRGLPVALGSCDPALASVLEGTLTAEGARVYNPAGRAARQHIIAQVLRSSWKTATSATWRAWMPFLRMDDVLRALCAEVKDARANIVLDQLDDFHATHLPPTIEDAIALSASGESHALLHQILKLAAERSVHWGAATCAEAFREILLWLYGGREFDTSREHDRQFSELFGKVLELAAQVDEVRGPSPAMDWMGHVLDSLEETQMSDLRGEADLVIHGWLELPWEPAPGLVIAGFNDEHVPGTPAIHPFLPDRARERLGLSCQAVRRSRDACLLRALVEQRRESGALHVVLGRVSAESDALRPSRLLLDASDADLPDRVRHLFPSEEDEAGGSPRPTRSLGFQLQPRLLPWQGSKISASDLRAYLACPFRFYLSRVLRLEEVGSGQREMSPADFGSLVHAVLESFARAPEISGSMDEQAIASWLESALQQQVLARHGPQPLFPVMLQAESIRQRLHAFASLQATQRRDGWHIIAVEEKITPEWGLAIGDVPLVGTIDRVERHESTGTLRIVDYKTSRSERGPAGTHWRKARAGETEDPLQSWKCFTDAKGTSLRWTDLQLPLYVAAASKKWPDATRIDAAYIALPSTVGDIGLKPFDQLDETLLASAWKCAEQAVEKIREGIFWPPADEAKYDDFADLFVGTGSQAFLPPGQWREVAA